MPVNFHTYQRTQGGAVFSEDYYKIRDFLISYDDPAYTYGRWDWMVTHKPYISEQEMATIGMWEEEGNLVGLAIYDTSLGDGFCLALDSHAGLKKELLQYAADKFSKDGKFRIAINDFDAGFQEIASQAGYVATPETECYAVIPIREDNTGYSLPEGYCVTSLEKEYNLFQYGRALYKGFGDGDGEYTQSSEDYQDIDASMRRPNVNLDIKIAVKAPNGDFVSYCGMWYDPASQTAIVEPVATDADYRYLGLGKAAVLEGVKRCGMLGAKRALVGSSKQFYYSIGFRPYAAATFWKRRHASPSR